MLCYTGVVLLLQTLGLELGLDTNGLINITDCVLQFTRIRKSTTWHCCNTGYLQYGGVYYIVDKISSLSPHV